MEIANCLDKKVSCQKDTWAPLSKEMTVNEVLHEIKNGHYKLSVEKLRTLINSNDLESYKAEKLKLPAVTFCGTFDLTRKKEQIKEYNSLIVLDIDKLKPEELIRIKQVLVANEYVFALWVSPSNNGIKGLVSLKFNFDLNANLDNAHKSAFNKLKNYFDKNYSINLDSSGNDTTRLCFVSYDENLILKEQASDFIIDESDLSIVYANIECVEEAKIKIRNSNRKDAFYNPQGKNKSFQRSEMRLYSNYLKKRKISITDEYENRYKIAYAIANSFTYDLGFKYFIDLCRLDPNYNEAKAIKLLEYCYENNTGWTKFNLIKEIVKNTGYNK